MKATALRQKGQFTLPSQVVEAAGLQINDQIDWRFEDGEIRGRKLVPQSKPRRIIGKLVERGGALVLETKGFQVDPDAIAVAVRQERDSH
jgi:bifunctional DNA-binding transcriptional regulator/antitoxin component of YhaV-PrlF toxin-antitoxin module